MKIDPNFQDTLDHIDPMERLRLEVELVRLLELYDPASFDNQANVWDPIRRLEPSFGWDRYSSDRGVEHMNAVIDATLKRHGRIPGLFRPRS